MESIYSSRESLIERSEAGTENEKKSVSFLQLFRFTTTFERLLMVFGGVVAVAVGLARPLMGSATGDVMQSFVNFTRDIAPLNDTDPEREVVYDHFHDRVAHACGIFMILGVFTFVTGFIMNTSFLIVSDRMIARLRKKFTEALLRQEVAWFDSQKTGAVTTQIFSDLERMKEGTGDHIGLGVYLLSMVLGGTGICLFYSWKLTLVTMSLSPVNLVLSWYQNKKLLAVGAKQTKVDGEAGAVCEQALTSMRTVMYFNGQQQEISRYEKVLKRLDQVGIRYALYTGIWYLFLNSVVISSLGICIWMGSKLAYSGELEAGEVIAVFLIQYFCLGRIANLGPVFVKVNRARSAAQSIYEIIDRIPAIDAYSSEGARPPVEGRITIQNLQFTYPTRADVPVLKDLTFCVEPGQTVALVGASGSGKSTIVQLLLRLYDPTGGRILIDGMEIDEFNIKYLRETIGIVQQEPVLFNTTIEENIRYGRENVMEHEMWTALRKANAHDFVKQFPKGLHTLVGDRGAQLSGGQKQRIAIARALVRDPRILLLDEATSALDSESERIVQDALEKASKGRTTLVIAHRLSTIRNADKIIAMRHGEIVESGTHTELLEKRGLYYDLVNNQVFVDTHEQEAKPEYHWSRSISSDGVEHTRRLRLFSGEAIQEEDDVLEDEDMKRLKEDLIKEDAKPASIWRVIKEARPQWKMLVVCLIACLLEGIIFPGMAFGFTELTRIFSGDKEEMLKEGQLMLYLFIAGGIYYGLTQLTHTSLFGVVSEKLSSRLRLKVYMNLMRQDAAYFDKPLHAPGRLMTRLGTDGNNMKPALNSRLGMIFSEIAMDIIGNGASLYFCWQMALVAMPIFPLSFLSWIFTERFVRQKTLQDEKEMEECGKIVMEATTNIRTVQCLNLQGKVHEKFCSHIDRTTKTNLKRDLLQSLCYGLAQSTLILINGVCFRVGLFFVYHRIADSQMVLRSIYLTGWSSCSLGSISSYLPDYIKAKMAAGLLFKMIDQEPKIDGMSKEGSRPDIQGNINVENLQFSYPERREVQVLKGIDLEMKQGQTVALVGSSGCGKSTVVSLLERMYDPDGGIIKIDGNGVRAMNTQHIRSNISIVSQEPVLFDLTIKENIVYGLPEGTVSHGEMVEAAKKANIHAFISDLPLGYATRVGDKGTQLSGGQKQRIAIARALVRKPRILILDEATSALDTESERHVQLALDQAKAGRSCLVIAHRLSTIINSDLILVFKEGKVVERGTHEELLAQKGVYYALIQKQSSSRSLE